MGNHEQIADPPALPEALRERPGKPTTAEPASAFAAPPTDRNETTIGPFLAALLRALSAWAT